MRTRIDMTVGHNDNMADTRRTTAKCPVCGRPTQESSRPFCSKRCRDVDLSRWLGGAYVVPGHEPADPEALARALSGTETANEA